MSPPDDKPAFESADPADAFDIDTDKGWEAYHRDLERRRPVPESLRYPETDEEWDRVIADSEADTRSVPAEKVLAWVRSWGTDNELPMPEPEEE